MNCIGTGHGHWDIYYKAKVLVQVLRSSTAIIDPRKTYMACEHQVAKDEHGNLAG